MLPAVTPALNVPREDFMLNPQKMNTLPPKPNLVVKGEMPADIAAKLGIEVKDIDPSVRPPPGLPCGAMRQPNI